MTHHKIREMIRSLSKGSKKNLFMNGNRLGDRREDRLGNNELEKPVEHSPLRDPVGSRNINHCARREVYTETHKSFVDPTS